MNKITLFLDIDGVIAATHSSVFINGFKTPHMGDYNKHGFDQNALGMIKRAAELVDANVVLCSTCGYRISQQELCILGATLGFSFSGVVDDDLITDRPDMIQKYLDQNPEILNYAIIDDSYDWYVGTPLDSHVVRVDEKYGFTIDNLYELSEVIGVDLMGESSKSRDSKVYSFDGIELLKEQDNG